MDRRDGPAPAATAASPAQPVRAALDARPPIGEQTGAAPQPAADGAGLLLALLRALSAWGT
jgi:hypothetical protein